jgi:hypothetical protein
LGSTIAESYIRLVFRTSRVLREPPDIDAKLFAQHPQIFAMWHDSYQELLRVKGCRQVSDSASLAEAALMLLGDDGARMTMQANVEAAIATMSGALDRTVLELERFLPPREATA